MDNNLFDDRRSKMEIYRNIRNKNQNKGKINIPKGLFIKCDHCNDMIYQDDFVENLYVCPKCNYHYRVNALDRISMICDEDTFTELFPDLESANPLFFPDYEQKIKECQAQTKELDAFVCGEGKIGNYQVTMGVLDSFFIMGSMGSVVGEKVTRLAEYATSKHLPLIIFSASGGARMQEGIFSLMQMVKTSAAIRSHDEAGLLYISVLTDPTTGGVMASFAGRGDIILAETGALIGFAGKRVIKQTIREDLPEGFQTAEFQLKKGFVDLTVDRKDMKNTLVTLLSLHQKGVYDGL